MFYGEYRHTIDSKGRLFIPSKLREKLGDTFMFSRGFDKYVCIYPMDQWEAFSETLEKLPQASERRIRRYFYAGAYEGNADAQGRVTVSQFYRDFAGLDKEVVIVGNRTHLEIWSLEAWEEEQKQINAADITDELIKLGF